jgi:AraC-like DNA-binding protein
MKLNTNTEFSIIDCFSGLETVKAHIVDQHFSKHVHEDYAIGVITGGAQKFYNLGGNHISDKGSLVVINADTVHTGEPISDLGCTYRAIYPTPDFINQIFSDIPSFGESAPFVHAPVITDQNMVGHLSTVFNYLDMKSPKLVVESLIYTFFLKMIAQYGRKHLPKKEVEANNNIDRVRDFLVEFSSENISLDDLAYVGNLNKYTLIKQFKKKWGLTPHQYHVQMRLHNAKKMLSLGTSPSEVALVCGFYDQSHFSSIFKKALGTTPNEYRLNVQPALSDK